MCVCVCVYLWVQSFVDGVVCMVIIIEDILLTIPAALIPGVCHLFLNRTLKNICYYASSYNLTFMNIERHSAIVNPMR